MKLTILIAVIIGFLGVSSAYALQSSDVQVIPNSYYFARYEGKDSIYIRDGENKDTLTFFDNSKLLYPSQEEIDYNKLDLGGLLVVGEGKAPIIQFTTYEGDKNSLKFKGKGGSFMLFSTCTNPNLETNVCQLFTYQYQLGDNGRIKGGGGGSILTTTGKGSYNILQRHGNYLLVQQLIGNAGMYQCAEKDTQCNIDAGGKIAENVNRYIINPVTQSKMYLGKGVDMHTIKIDSIKKSVQFKKFIKQRKGYSLSKLFTRKI